MSTTAEKIKKKYQRDVFKHVEAELYAYPYNKKEIERLREQILYPYKPNDDGGGKGNLPSKPTETTAVTLATHAKLVHMEKVNDAIAQVYNQLDDKKRELVELKYWTHPQKLTTVGICMKLGISDRTYSRWRRAIVSAIAEILGWG